jgi:hypothetical protein
MANRTGGGINSRAVGNYRDRKTEPVTHAVSPGAVSRLGAKVGVGTPHESLYQGKGYSTPIGPSDNMAAGPGANRMIMRAGSQSKTPAPTPMRGPRRSLFD